MWWAIGGIAGFGLFLWAVIAQAKAAGKKAAQLEALKTEAERIAKEQERANAINDTVDRMPADAVRQRLQNVGRK